MGGGEFLIKVLKKYATKKMLLHFSLFQLLALHKPNPDPDVISTSDEIHIYLFARVAREKEEW